MHVRSLPSGTGERYTNYFTYVSNFYIFRLILDRCQNQSAVYSRCTGPRMRIIPINKDNLVDADKLSPPKIRIDRFFSPALCGFQVPVMRKNGFGVIK